MVDWMGLITRVGLPMEAGFDRLRRRLRRRVAERNDFQILPYRGFGNEEQIYLKGRVLLAAQAGPCEEGDGLWRNVLATYRRFNSREVPGVPVELILDGKRHEVRTDPEGYFEFVALRTSQVTGWVPVKVGFVKGSAEEAEVLIPGSNARFGVISDIDDTVVVSHARNFLKMARTVFLRNARGRVAFPGVAAFFRALQAGVESKEYNPIFYVSSGPWNLYDLLIDFFELNEIPRGPLLLQDFGLEERKVITGSHREHKVTQINLILRMYPDLPFILVGDSGQHDPEIYLHALEMAPNRIKAIYIRDVAGETRDEEIRRLAKEAAKHGGELLLVQDSLEAARHAASRGFILEAELETIGRDKMADIVRPDVPLT